MAKPSKQEIDDMRKQSKLEDAYNRSLNTTEIPGPAPAPMPPASAPKKYAKGGSIDGIAQRGKTRGKYC